MTSRKTVGAAVAGLGLVLTSVLGGGAIAATRGADPTAPRQATPWAGHLTTMDEALRAGDVPGAQKAWHEAYGAALGSRRWEGFADAADAALRLGRASGAPGWGVPRARDLYLSALFRARDTGSLDGVLRVGAAFNALGDREVSAHAARMAHHLAARGVTPSQRAQMAGLTTSDRITVPEDI